MRYELSDFEWSIICPELPNKPRGVPRVDDRRILNGIFWVLRSGASWRDLPDNYGPYTTCYNRFNRWRKAGIWDQILDAVTVASDEVVQMIDTSVVRVHQHAACTSKDENLCTGRTRGGLTTKIHAVVDANGLPIRLAIKDPICFSPYLYRARNRVERFFNRIKHYRRIATRYEKQAVNYLAFLKLASVRLWLRAYESTS